MPRWDYDTVLYRVFCITLLGVAFTFTVILTNVFIDIDGLLYKKSKAKSDNIETVHPVEIVTSTNILPDNAYDYRDYGDYDGERTKRSLESQDFSLHIKDQKMKEVINNRLAALLEDLDKEESPKTIVNAKNDLMDRRNDEMNKKMYDEIEYKEINFGNIPVPKNNKTNYDIEIIDSKNVENERIEILDDIERIKKEKDEKMNNTEELKHLAMHNIILQGIIGHMDLGDVYARVHAVINSLDNLDGKKDNLKEILYPADKKFFNELMNCDKLRDSILAESLKREMLTTTTETSTNKKTAVKPAARNVMVKAIIDITSLANDRNNQDDTSSKENVNGIIKLIYNGKSLRFRRIDENVTIKPKMLRQVKEKSANLLIESNVGKDIVKVHGTDSLGTTTYVPKLYMNNIIKDYLKKYLNNSEERTKLTTKRLKRHIRISYENDETTTGTPINQKKDDELLVEIETHFDGKGLKGEKKKQMIRDLVEKIQNAIHSEKDVKKRKHKHLHVKKRTQNPLDSVNAAVDKILSPLNDLIHRDLEPISKSVPIHEKLPHVAVNKGEEWRKYYIGPTYLSLSKAINSAEMSTIDTDYNIVADNGIPQRLQQPLNRNDEALNSNVNNPGNVKLLLKDIAGSGFSIGFNQYVAEPPDEESMKLFTGIKNIIQTYHQKYDEEEASDDTNVDTSPNHENNAPQNDDHTIVRRSIKKSERDYHSNEYKVIYNKNFLKFDNYQDVYNSKGHWSNAKNIKSKKQYSSLVIDDNIFEKNLKPAEIFSLADLLDRKKRSMIVQKISNIKTQKKLNRYLNTRGMASKMIYLQKNRSKREIDKIRIIAKDLSKYKHNSEEDIFILSNEKLFADRALVKEEETPELTSGLKMAKEHYDVITPDKSSQEHFDVLSQKANDNHYDIISPYYEEPETYDNNVFTRRSRHNALMSKYPHIFMEEITKSKEDYKMPANSEMKRNMVENFPVTVDNTTPSKPTVEVPQYNIPQDDIHPNPQEKNNYRVTVKIMPKNTTGVNSGFKEVHTSINKSYNKNGLKYTSLVNVTEISKVEKINKTKDDVVIPHPSEKKIKRQHLRIKTLIQQHKDRIEEQLAHLNQEKEKLERLDTTNTDNLKETEKDTLNDYVDVPLSTHPTRILHLTKEDLSKLIHFEQTTTEEPATTVATTKYIETTIDPTKIHIINTIERNENITKEILNKIDRNTDLLQTFLDKLIDKIKETTVTPEVYRNPEEIYKNNDNYEDKIKEDVSKKPQILRTKELFNQIPNIFFNAKSINGTGIPFIYAFQQPYTMPSDKNIPISSVVYQGHIHANTVNYNKPEAENGSKLGIDNIVKKNNWKDKPKANVEVKNDTKFFIDDFLNDYKVLPIGKTTFPTKTNSTV